MVSREEIRRHVWGDAVYIDASQSINFCIHQIRLALGDTSAGARFVETLPRQGYRFVAPVEGAREKTFIPEPPPIEKARPTVSTRRLIRGLAVFIALTTLLCWWGWLLQRSTVSGVARISPITTFPGDEREPSLSPDGREVAFSWGGENGENRDIYV